jgi:hypothetical protein
MGLVALELLLVAQVALVVVEAAQDRLKMLAALETHLLHPQVKATTVVRRWLLRILQITLLVAAVVLVQQGLQEPGL